MFLANERYIHFTESGRNGFFDLENDRVCVPAVHKELSRFSGNVLMTREGDVQYLISLEGKRISLVAFSRCREFVDGIAAASVPARDWETSLFGFINVAGERVAEPRFKYLESRPHADDH